MHKKTPITIQIFLHNYLRNIQQQDIIHIFFLKRLKGHYFIFLFLFSGGTKQTNNQLGTPRKKSELPDVKLKIPRKRPKLCDENIIIWEKRERRRRKKNLELQDVIEIQMYLHFYTFFSMVENKLPFFTFYLKNLFFKPFPQTKWLILALFNVQSICFFPLLYAFTLKYVML